MTKRQISACLLFFVPALASAIAFHASKADAAPTWRQYSTIECRLNAGQSVTTTGTAEILNYTVGEMGPPPTTAARMDCPIVEDESLHAKGGTVVNLIFQQYASNYSSYFMACKTYQAASGGTCSAEVRTSGSPAGIRSFSLTPSASDWQTGTDFGYIHLGLGSRGLATDSPNAFKGYWISHI